MKPISCPKEITADLQNLNSSDGWSKYFAKLQNLSLDKIVVYIAKIEEN